MFKKKILVTGGNGFIGQNFLSKLNKKNYKIINIDCISSSADKFAHKKFKWVNFYKINLCNNKKISEIFLNFKPDLVVNIAAHSHVDRSIYNSRIFMENINGTYNLLENSLKIFKKKKIKFLQISTDEVFGSINKGFFNVNSAYKPNSPYSASKASCDHLVRSFNKTYGLPTITSFSCNNYGPLQNLEKLIPLTIFSFINKKKMGIYGKGLQRRQWIYVDDNINAIVRLLSAKFDGSTYCIGSKYEIDNLSLVRKIIKIMNRKIYSRKKYNYLDHVKFVKDRPGHDKRYFLEHQSFEKKFFWKQKFNLEKGLESTIDWYLSNKDWIKRQKKNLIKFF